jgi:hypothetical protein
MLKESVEDKIISPIQYNLIFQKFEDTITNPLINKLDKLETLKNKQNGDHKKN